MMARRRVLHRTPPHLVKRDGAKERLAKLSECLLSFGVDPGENINRLVGLCGEELGAICALYNRLEDGKLCAWGQWHVPADFNPVDDPDGHICYDVIRSSREDPCVIRNLPDTVYARTDPNVLRYGLKTYVGKPVSFGKAFVGSLCVLYVDDRVLGGEDLEFLGIVASAIGVEERRKQAEAALRESEERLRTILDKVQIGVLIIDPSNHIIVGVNPAAAHLIGASADQIVGRTCHNYVCPADVGRCPLTDLQQQVDNSERILLRADGGSRQIMKTVIPVILGGRSHLLESFVDITLRKEAEEALADRTRQLEAVQAVTEEITRELDLTALLQLITQRAAELVGVGAGSIYLWDEAAQLLLTRAWTGYGAWRGEVRLRLGEGVGGMVAKQRRGMIVNDYRTSPYALPIFLERTPTTAVLAEPLLYGDRLLGVIMVTNDGTDRHFAEKDRRILALFATEAAIAIENARLYEAAQRQVAERALAEEVLAQERNLLRTLIDNVPDRIYIKDTQGRYLLDNATHRHCLRAPGPEAVIGKTIFDFYPREVAEPSDQVDRAVLASGEKLVNQEEVFVDRDTGALDWDLTTKVPLRDSHGTVIGLVSIGRTITERKRAEEALAERTRQLEAVRAVTAEITRELDLTALLRLIARHTRDLAQATSVTINLWDDEAQVLVPQTWLGFDAWRGEVRLRLGEGVAGTVAQRREGLIVNDFRTSSYALPIFLERSTYSAVLAEPLLYRARLIGVLAVAREQTGPPFTEKDRQLLALFATQAAIAIENAQLYRQVQDHAQILERRVEERTQALKEAQAELVQSAKLAAVGMLAAGVAHELNQPLTIIRGYAQHLASERGLADEARAALNHVRAQSERMATIVNHLRDFSRQTKGTYEAVALNEVVAGAFLMLRQQLRVRKIEVVQALEPALPAIWGDRFQLEQVFINLITNARDAVQPQGGGRLTVTSRTVGDWVEVAVADTGPGVPVDLQDRIFEPFFTTKEVGDGTGLGLSISYGIIREHGGEIRVANRPEGGAEFVVRLPVRPPAQPGGNSADARNGA